MLSHRARRAGRQIPADVMIGTVFALSLFFGLPITRALRLHFPTASKWLLMALGIGAGFLILVAFCALVFLISGWFARKK